MGHTESISCVRFSPSGKHLATASADRTIIIWDARSGEHVRTLRGHTGGVSSVAWAPSTATCSDSTGGSGRVCSASDDCTLKMWNVESGSETLTFAGHQGFVFAVDVCPNGDTVVSGSFDCTVRLWDAATGKCLRAIAGHADPVSSVHFNKDGSLFASGGFDGLARVWDTKTGHCLSSVLQEANPRVCSVQFSPNGKYLLVGTFGGRLRLWNYAQCKALKSYRGHTNERYCVHATFCVHNGDAVIVSGSEDGNVLLWDLQTKTVAYRLAGHANAVVAVDGHPTEAIIATGELRNSRSMRGPRAPADADSEATLNVDLETDVGSEKDVGPVVRIWKAVEREPGSEASPLAPVRVQAPLLTPLD